jgi:hypothetical protein
LKTVTKKLTGSERKLGVLLYEGGVAVGIREERRGEEEALIYLIYLSVLHFD